MGKSCGKGGQSPVLDITNFDKGGNIPRLVGWVN